MLEPCTEWPDNISNPGWVDTSEYLPLLSAVQLQSMLSLQSQEMMTGIVVISWVLRWQWWTGNIHISALRQGWLYLQATLYSEYSALAWTASVPSSHLRYDFIRRLLDGCSTVCCCGWYFIPEFLCPRQPPHCIPLGDEWNWFKQKPPGSSYTLSVLITHSVTFLSLSSFWCALLWSAGWCRYRSPCLIICKDSSAV